MKRITDLYDSICHPDNLRLAYEKARRGKGRRYGVKLFAKHLEANLARLREELVTETYRTPEYIVFMIHDPKEREVYRLPFRDRVVHHAIMNVLEPTWTSIFITHSYSCIKGRGIHGAMRHIKRDLLDVAGTTYCLKLDIRKFYPSVDHDVLKDVVRRKIKDARLLRLLDGIIDSAPGVPIGNYLSQFFANLYLSYFDHWIKEEKRARYYYRYADDMVILGPDKPYLHALLVEITTYLFDHLKLDVKGNYQVFPVNARGIDFLGYVFRHTHVRLRKSIKVRLCRKAARLNKRNLPAKAYKMALASHMGWARHCDSRNLIKKVTEYEKIL
jgi:retron-type reverse transcriptase